MKKLCTFQEGEYQEVYVEGNTFLWTRYTDREVEDVEVTIEDCFLKEWSIDFGWIGNNEPIKGEKTKYAVWSCGTWCEAYEIPNYVFLSDDYEIIEGEEIDDWGTPIVVQEYLLNKMPDTIFCPFPT
jgi:hypothetical protein